MDLAMKIKKLFFLESKLKKGSFTKGSPERRVPDMNKTEKTIKVFKYVNLQEGLKITLNWYLLNFKKKFENSNKSKTVMKILIKNSYNKFNYFDPSLGWSTGPTALNLASEESHFLIFGWYVA